MTAEPKIILEMQSVSKRYGDQGAAATQVLTDADLALAAGESLAVVGPSGSGKSTLLNIAGALDLPTTGRVLLEDRDLSTLTDRELAEVRNERIGFVFQLHHLLPQCTVWENVLVPTLARPSARDACETETRAEALLTRVGLADRMSYRPGQLSGGERQRVAVVRALINRPVLLLADEPTGSLDRASAEALVELLIELNRDENVTLVVVTHAMYVAEAMQHVLELRDGTLTEASE